MSADPSTLAHPDRHSRPWDGPARGAGGTDPGASLERFLVTHRGALVKHAAYYASGHAEIAEDAVQSACIGVLRTKPTLLDHAGTAEGDVALLAYVRTAVKHQVFTLLRKSRREVVCAEIHDDPTQFAAGCGGESESTVSPGADAMLEEREDRAQDEGDIACVKAAVDELPSSQRDVVWMVVAERRSCPEVARELGLSPKAVDKRCRRGVLRLFRSVRFQEDRFCSDEWGRRMIARYERKPGKRVDSSSPDAIDAEFHCRTCEVCGPIVQQYEAVWKAAQAALPLPVLATLGSAAWRDLPAPLRAVKTFAMKAVGFDPHQAASAAGSAGKIASVAAGCAAGGVAVAATCTLGLGVLGGVGPADDLGPLFWKAEERSASIKGDVRPGRPLLAGASAPGAPSDGLIRRYGMSTAESRRHDRSRSGGTADSPGRRGVGGDSTVRGPDDEFNPRRLGAASAQSASLSPAATQSSGGPPQGSAEFSAAGSGPGSSSTGAAGGPASKSSGGGTAEFRP